MWRLCFGAMLAVFAAGGQTGKAIPVDGTPLWRAKLALETARARVLENRYDAASGALRDTAHALADYEKLSPGPHAETARFIRQEIESYGPQIARRHEDALDRIDLWRGPIDEWYRDVHK